MENIIPLKNSIPLEKILKVSENVDSFITEFEGSLSPFIIKNIKKEDKKRKIEQTYLQRQLKIKGLAEQGVITKGQARSQKTRLFVLKYWNKIAKNKTFEKMLTGVKGLLSKGGNFIFDILKMLMLMSIFPGLSEMIFGIIGDLLNWGIAILTEKLPPLVKKLIQFIKDNLPGLVKKLGDGILNVFNVPKDSPLRKLVDSLAKNSPAILGFLAVLSILAKVAPIFLLIWKVLGLLWTVIGWVWTVLQVIWVAVELIAFSMSIAVGWVVAIIAGIVLLGVLIYVFRKEIWNFITKTIPKAFMWLVKGIKKVMSKLLEIMLYPYKKLWETIKNIFGKLSSIISFDGIKKSLDDAITNLPQNLLDAFGSLKGAITKRISELTTSFIDMFHTIQARIKGFMASILGNKQEASSAMVASYAVNEMRLNGVNEDDLKKYLYAGKDSGYTPQSLSDDSGTQRAIALLKTAFDNNKSKDNSAIIDAIKTLKSNPAYSKIEIRKSNQ